MSRRLVREPSPSQVLMWTAHPEPSGPAGASPAGPLLRLPLQLIVFGADRGLALIDQGDEVDQWPGLRQLGVNRRAVDPRRTALPLPLLPGAGIRREMQGGPGDGYVGAKGRLDLVALALRCPEPGQGLAVTQVLVGEQADLDRRPALRVA